VSPAPLLPALIGLAALLALACQEGSDPQFTPVPASTFEPRPGPPAITDSARPADAGDAGADTGDAGADAADAGADDALPDVAPDATPDAEAARTCESDQDCVLAVQLDACDPCPIAAHIEGVLADRCRVVYVNGATLGTYAPADCWADCGEAIGEPCLEGPAAAVCDPPRVAGRCTIFR